MSKSTQQEEAALQRSYQIATFVSLFIFIVSGLVLFLVELLGMRIIPSQNASRATGLFVLCLLMSNVSQGIHAVVYAYYLRQIRSKHHEGSGEGEPATSKPFQFSLWQLMMLITGICFLVFAGSLFWPEISSVNRSGDVKTSEAFEWKLAVFFGAVMIGAVILILMKKPAKKYGNPMPAQNFERLPLLPLDYNDWKWVFQTALFNLLMVTLLIGFCLYLL